MPMGPCMIDDMEQLIEGSVHEVFSTMLSIQVRSEPCTGPLPGSESQIAGAVGFIGRMSGVVYLYCTNSFARCITCHLLGLEEKDIDSDEMVNDAVGEMANMIVGHIKSRLSDRGMPCVLTIPSIVRGKNFSVEPVSRTESKLFCFHCNEHQLLVEVLLRSAEKPAVAGVSAFEHEAQNLNG